MDASDGSAPLPDASDAGMTPCEVSASTGNVIGCDYVAIFPSMMDNGIGIGACAAVVVVNTNEQTLTLSVQYQGTEQVPYHSALIDGHGQSASYSALPSGDQVPPGVAAVVVLADPSPSGDDCLVPLTAPIVDHANIIDVDTPVNGVGNAFRVQTSLPAVAYQMWGYTVADWAPNNVIPLRAAPSWVKQYTDVGTYIPGCDAGGAEFATGNAWTAAVASVAGTTVSMPSAQNGTISNTLAAYQLLNVARCNEFIGQTVTANNPFALWVGTAGLQVPSYADCEPTENFPALQVAQTADWGHTYAFARQDNRPPATDERTFMRIIAAADGTILTYSPSVPSGAPTTLSQGEMGTFWAYDPFVVSSGDANHPIFVVAHMVDPRDFDSNCLELDASTYSTEGSNAMHAAPSVEHWGTRYDLFMPLNSPASELVVVRAIGGNDVTLDCAGTITGWQPIDTAYEFTRVWISQDTNGTFNPVVYTSGTCDTGVHTISSVGSFGVTAYGWISAPFNGNAWLFGWSYAYAPLSAHATVAVADGGPQ